MKKIIMLLTVAAMLATSVIGVSAYAPEDGKYNVTYADAKIVAGEYYGVVVMKGKDAAVDFSNLENILYIDQVTAATAGSITIPEFATKGVAPGAEGFVEGTIYIGGEGFGTATNIGYTENVEVEEPEDPKYTISGTITDTKTSKEATVTVKAADESVVGTATTVSGAYTITDVPVGTYSVVVEKVAYCPYTVTEVTVADTNLVVNADVSSLAGDVDESGYIVLGDLSAVLTDYGKSSGFENENADVDNSGYVVLGDLSIVLGNYGNSGIVEPYAAE